MLKLIKFVLWAGMMTGATVAVAADLPPAEVTNDVMATCRPDYYRVCSEVLPGDGRIGRCLLDHERDLSPGCLKKVKIAYAIEVCMPDYHRFCQGVPPGAANAVQCLAHRMGALHPECERVVAANAPYFIPEGPHYGDNRYGAPDGGPGREPYPYRGYSDAGPRDSYPSQPYGDDRDRYAGGGYGPGNGQPSDGGRYTDHGYYSNGPQADGDRRYDDEGDNGSDDDAREPPR